MKSAQRAFTTPLLLLPLTNIFNINECPINLNCTTSLPKRTLELFIPRSRTLPWPRIARKSTSLGTCRCHSSLSQQAKCTRQISFRTLSRQFWTGKATRTAMQVSNEGSAAPIVGRYCAAYDMCGLMRTARALKTPALSFI